MKASLELFRCCVAQYLWQESISHLATSHADRHLEDAKFALFEAGRELIKAGIPKQDVLNVWDVLEEEYKYD